MKLSKNLLSSDNPISQCLGAVLSGYEWCFALLLLSIPFLLDIGFQELNNSYPLLNDMHSKIAVIKQALFSEWFAFSICLLFFFIVYRAVHVLTPLYTLRKEEVKITWAQIILLISFGLLIISFIFIFHIQDQGSTKFIGSVVGFVLAWVFQDAIKSAAAFCYLRFNDLIHIDDWIEVKSHGINGMIRGITLTTVTLENWDTTTSSFPTHILLSGHFQNNQKMLDGRTHGRRMEKTFIIDTAWIHTLSEAEANRLRQRICQDEQWLMEEGKIVEGALNIELFRLYIYHWLMRHEKVSHEPRLLVRWLDQTNEGMPLQIYAFITDTKLAQFEWQQSQIIEHVIRSLEWFDLQLYQSPSGYDASNSNIYLTDKEATYRKMN